MSGQPKRRRWWVRFDFEGPIGLFVGLVAITFGAMVGLVLGTLAWRLVGHLADWIAG